MKMRLQEAKQILKKAGYLMEAGRNTRFKRNVINFDELDNDGFLSFTKLYEILKNYIGETKNYKYGNTIIEDVKFNKNDDIGTDEYETLTNSISIFVRAYGDDGDHFDETYETKIYYDMNDEEYKVYDASEHEFIDGSNISIDWKSNNLNKIAEQIIQSCLYLS